VDFDDIMKSVYVKQKTVKDIKQPENEGCLTHDCVKNYLIKGFIYSSFNLGQSWTSLVSPPRRPWREKTVEAN